MNATGIGRWATWGPAMQSLLRIVAAVLFVFEGTTKLLAFPFGIPPAGHAAAALTLPWVAGVLETFGGTLLALGLFTRPVAFVLSGEMAVAYFLVHAPRGFWPMRNGGMPAVLYCFLWLYFSAAGAGPWSLDARRRRPIAEVRKFDPARATGTSNPTGTTAGR